MMNTLYLNIKNFRPVRWIAILLLVFSACTEKEEVPPPPKNERPVREVCGTRDAFINLPWLKSQWDQALTNWGATYATASFVEWADSNGNNRFVEIITQPHESAHSTISLYDCATGILTCSGDVDHCMRPNGHPMTIDGWTSRSLGNIPNG